VSAADAAVSITIRSMPALYCDQYFS
jgi:hypothetical protein